MEVMKSYLYLLVTGAVCLVACTKQLESPVAGEETPVKVTFEVPALRNGDAGPETRMTLTPSGNVARLEWESTDRVGIFPGTGSQVFFSMASGVGSTVASFDGGSWALRENAQYHSYYPYVDDVYLDPSRIPVTFEGQCQTGLSGTHGVRHYMASGGTTASDGSLRFRYSLLNAILRLNLTLPAGTYTKVTLTAPEPVFVKEGHFDLTSPVIVADRYTRTLEVALDQFVVSSASTVQVYLSCAPVDLVGKTLSVKVFSSDGETYECEKTPSVPYQAGDMYGLSCPLAQSVLPAGYYDREEVWGWYGGTRTMPEEFNSQYAATAAEAADPSFDPNLHRRPYLLWHDKPAQPNGTCAILVAGEDYNQPIDTRITDYWAQELTKQGVQCVTLVYRVPQQPGHFCRTAWQDAQRAVRVIRCETLFPNEFNREIDANKIGVVGFGAGGHLALMMATFSASTAYLTAANYTPDAVDQNIACNVNWAIVHAPQYVTSDSIVQGAGICIGTIPDRDGYGPDVTLDPLLFGGAGGFDAQTCPICFIHGQDDPHSPMASTKMYRRLRQTSAWGNYSHIPGEVHLYPNKGHEVFGFERGMEFLTQMGYMGTLQPEVTILSRYASDGDCLERRKENVWPSIAQTPDYQAAQSVYGEPEIEWFFPRERKTKAIQIIYSGGSYHYCSNESFEVAATRRYLNAKGMTVVTLKYRTPRPAGLAKHISAWQDLQRSIRLVRSEAASFGLDPDRIGIMGSSAGGHLTLMGATSSQTPAYNPVDAVDGLPCKVQWAIACCPAYALTDDYEFWGYEWSSLSNQPTHGGNVQGGNADDWVLVPEFSFDQDTPPMLFMHGDEDRFAAMNSVKAWEKLRSMGIPGEVHTFAMGPHEFMRTASPGTGRYTCLDRIGEFVERYW